MFGESDFIMIWLKNEIVKIACGFWNTLVLKEGGRIYGAGRSDFICEIDGKSLEPIPGLGDDLDFIDIEIGGFHSLALTQDFQVFGWGDNNEGQLGIGDDELRMNLVKLELP